MTSFPVTDWTRYDVPSIAAMLLDDDFADSWSQVYAWLAAYETISVHHGQLVRAEAELAEAWPPDKSPASAAYLENVAELRASMAATAEIAFNNSRAVSNSLDALSAAQVTIRQIHQQWQAEAASTSADTTDAAWAGRLNAQAQQVMRTTDQIIFENTQRLVPPTVMPIFAATEPLKPVSTGDPANARTQKGSNGAAIARSTSGTPATVSTKPITETANASRQSDNSSILGTTTTMATSETTVAGAAAAAVGLLGIKRSRAIASTRTATGSAMEDTKAGQDTSSVRPTPVRAQSSASSVTTGNPSASGERGSSSETGEMLAPGLGMTPPSSNSSRGPRRRRGRSLSLPDPPRVVPSLIVPRPPEPIVHDPGPGVIGIDR